MLADGQRRASRKVWCMVFAIGLAGLVPASSAGAQSSPNDLEARRLFEAGSMAYDDARYEEAVQHFRRAYELSGRSELLYNVGQAADRLRRDAEALEAFEDYLAASPNADNRRQVEVRIEVLRRQLAMAEAARSAEDADQASSEPVDLRSDDSEATRNSSRRAVWIGLVAGVVVAGLAVGLGVGLTRENGAQQPLPGDPRLGTGGVIQTLGGGR